MAWSGGLKTCESRCQWVCCEGFRGRTGEDGTKVLPLMREKDSDRLNILASWHGWTVLNVGEVGLYELVLSPVRIQIQSDGSSIKNALLSKVRDQSETLGMFKHFVFLCHVFLDEIVSRVASDLLNVLRAVRCSQDATDEAIVTSTGNRVIDLETVNGRWWLWFPSRVLLW